VIQEIKSIPSGGCEIVIENVGSRVALDVVLSIPGDSKVVAAGLRSGERRVARLPHTCAVDLLYRDAVSNVRQVSWPIEIVEGVPLILPPSRPSFGKRMLIKAGFVAAEYRL
jgi:hypothetical protein